MKLKNQLSSIMALLVVVLSAIFISAFLLSSQLNNINESWHKTNQTIMAKNNALFQLSRHFGYGGFIHHFKNLVLRQTEHYYQSAKSSMEQTHQAIDLYKSLTQAELELTLINEFEQTVLKYQSKLELIEAERLSQNQNIHDLDEQVKVDDAQAIAALNILSLQIAQNNKSSIDLFNRQYQNIDKTNRVQLLIIIPLILISGIALTFYAIRVTRAYSELETIFNVSPDALIVLNTSGQIVRANPKACDIFGYSFDEFQRLTIEALVPVEFRGGHAETRQLFQRNNAKREIGSPHAEVKAVHKTGKIIPVEITLATYGEQDSQKTIANVKDLSHYKNLETLSTTDHLTGIANRLKLDALLDDEIDRAKRYQQALSFIIIDIDHFKKVNDTFGHQEGDKVLQGFARLLQTRIRNIDVCGRWGGEEFCIICPATSGSEAYRLAEDLRGQIEASEFGQVDGLTASFGLASFKQQQDSFKDLIHRADIALYQSKQYGRNQVTLAS